MQRHNGQFGFDSTSTSALPRIALSFVLKVVSRCNLDCTYCYVYNKGDDTWRHRPPVMPDHVLDAAINRIEEWCRYSGQQDVRITFHGGEPLLAGKPRFADWCSRIQSRLAHTVRVALNVQTNGTLLDAEWARIFAQHNCEVGVSIDGPSAIHDKQRVDHRGRGSHAQVVSGIKSLHDAGLDVAALCVIQFGVDSVAVHRHISSLGIDNVNYLLPDFTHDEISRVRAQYGTTPCADYLIPIFEDWWVNGSLDTRITIFWAIARLVLGGQSIIDLLGNKPFGFVFIEADGAIEGLDVLRVCRHGMAETGLNVLADAIGELGRLSDLHRAAIFDGVPLPDGCSGCPEATTCAGGYLPHRWSAESAFNNRSVWCADLLALFGHIRGRLGVSTEETALRRQALMSLGEDAPKLLDCWSTQA
jgi:uncharacterized protein